MKRIFALLLSIFLILPITIAFANDEFVVGFSAASIEMNPYKAIYTSDFQLFTAIYEGLFSYDSNTLEPVRALAEDFSKSADGKTWTFYLRQDAKWADGSEITARDFVESWLFLLTPSLNAEFAVFFDIIKGAEEYRKNPGRAASTVGIKAIDTKTLVVELNNPAAYFTRLLCHGAFVPIHPSLRNSRNWQDMTIIGNGPYNIQSINDKEISLKKSPTYWDREAVEIENLRIVFLASDAEGSQRYNSGEIHWILDAVDLDTLLMPEDFQYSSMFGTGYFFWDSGKKPWDDSRVRRALALLIPWEKIRSEDIFYSPTSSLILPFDVYRQQKGITERNEKEALALLSQAGYKDPSRLPVIKLVLFESNTMLELASIMGKAWAEYGISVEYLPVSEYQDMRAIRQNEFDISFTGWIGDFADPIAFLLMWLSDSGLNEAGYKNSEYDKIIRESMSSEGRARMQLLQKAEAMLLDDAVIMPVYHSMAFNIIDTSYISGWYNNPLDIHPFKTIKFSGRKALPAVAMLGGEREF